MNRNVFLTSILSLMVIAGCNGTNDAVNEQQKIVDELAPTQDSGITNENKDYDRLEYVDYSKNPLNSDMENHTIQMDRSKMANTITQSILQNNGFDKAATLLTNEEVFIAYQKNDAVNNHYAAKFVRNTAESFVPSYYNIYVSENRSLLNDIQGLQKLSVEDKNYDRITVQIINEMKKSPQGLNK